MKKYRWLRLLTLGLVVFQTFAFGFKGNIALAAAPDTVITARPDNITPSTNATFEFEATDSPVTFECSLDDAAFTACTSPYSATDLALGNHTFKVQAKNAMDETDASPAEITWLVSPFESGDGSLGTPFIVTSCSQLEQIDSFLTSHYQLGESIDCTGVTFTSIASGDTAFGGTFDGNGYTISNLTTTRGLFAHTEDAVIHNFILRDASIAGDTDNSVAAVVGYCDMGSALSNIHVYDTDVVSTHGYAGGVAGFVGNNSSVSESSFIGGSVTSPGHPYVGGIASALELGEIENVVSRTHIEGNSAGGIVGTVDYDESVVNNAYSDATFDSLGENNGGLIGMISGGTVAHVFSVANMKAGGGTNVGAVFGNFYEGVTASDVVFDRSSTGISACTGTGTVTCTAVNASNSNPNYFKNNSTNAPLNSWSFGSEGTWHVNYNDYPTLTPVSTNGFECTNPYRSLTAITTTCSNIEPGYGTNTWELQYKISAGPVWIAATLADTHSGEMSLSVAPVSDYDLRVRVTNDSGTSEWLNMESNLMDTDSDGANDLVENNAPRAGDGNDDSQHDVEQANVYSDLNPVSGNFTTLVTSCDNNYNVQIGGESSEHADANYSYPEGLVGFIGRDCGAPGATVNVEIYFYGDYDASKFVLRKSSGTGTYTTIDDAVLTSTTIGGQKVLKATYQVVDGGVLDADGIADGNIVDPVGIAQSTVTVPDTGLQHKSVAGSMFAFALGLIALAYVTKKEIFAGSLAK